MRAWALAGCIALAGCASAPVQPTSVAHGAIVVKASVRGAKISFLRRYASTAHFIHVDSNGRLDRDHLIASNAAADGYIYLLDIPPGRYAMVELSFVARLVRYRAELDDKMAQATIVDVKPGRISFMGYADLQRDWQGWDVQVDHAAINIGALITFWTRPDILLPVVMKPVDHSLKAEAAALLSARKTLAGTTWLAVVETRLRELNIRPPLPKHGFFRRRGPDAIKSKYFYGYDLLKWGRGHFIPGGLEWRHPKRAARIDIAYLLPGLTSWQPRERLLRVLREEGEGSDTHTLYETTVSSRAAYGVRFSKHLYASKVLLGSNEKIVITEAFVVPDGDTAYYLIKYQAEQAYFEKFLPDFRRFIRYMTLAVPPKEEKKTEQ